MNRIEESPMMNYNQRKYDSNVAAVDELRVKMGYPTAKKGKK